MTDNLSFADQEKPVLPPMLNVLTILTFIGSGLLLVYAAVMPKLMSFSKAMMDKAAASGQEFSAKQLADMEQARRATDLVMANMLPLILISLVGAILCIAGAMMMRKLKKDGYWVYVGGELMPVLAGFIIMGTAQYTGALSVILGLGLPITFVILYALQRKYLVK